MSYQKIVTEDQRLAVLQILAQDPSYSHNQHVIKTALGYVGHQCGTDTVRTLLSWLEEQGLVMLKENVGMLIAKLTARGKDVATGSVIVPGVKQPEPEV